jgi:hypothetical protein
MVFALFGVAFGVVGVPCVDHLKDWGDKQERGRGREITVDKEIPN